MQNKLRVTVSIKQNTNQLPERDDDESSAHTEVIEDLYNVLYNSNAQ